MAPWLSPSTLGWLTASAAPVDLPVVTHLAGGRLPALMLVHDDAVAPAQSRLVLRLWPTDIELAGEKQTPVWIGSVVEEQLSRHVSLFTSASTGSDMNAGRNTLAEEFSGGKFAIRPNSGYSDWDGRVLLLVTSQSNSALSATGEK